ncbi:flagellar hook-length control protein FliK [Magnetospirillum sp. SS-4]|uniref:flagellar hook-length control protein FliK n=1 Tax=Magnetospirillum sp. SS-4 TaxID=2681465 RepID=UPI0013804CC5|nr:flagellar hook-length control protein FliK [Magnetospirillum sp. SS-4]CAA7627499.1 Flagellar hook-length control protein [Magnetospirillum sp. SS-4]
MTVQSIDKRVVPETNMTPAGQDRPQGSVSAEDAFVALLSQTSQRFGNKLAGSTSATTVLANHFSRKQAEPKAERPQPNRDDAAPARTAAKDARPAAKTDRPRQAEDGAAASRKADAKDAAPVKTDKAEAPAASDDAAAPAETSRADAGQDNQADPQAQDEPAVQVVVQPRTEIEIEVAALQAETTVASDAAAGDAAAVQAEGDDPLAGLGKDDRQRVTDLGKLIVADKDADASDEALDAATKMVDHLIRQAGAQQAKAGPQQTGETDLMREQAAGLTEMVANTGVRLDVKVQTTANQPTATVETAAAVTESFTRIDPALQGEAEQGFDPSARQQGGQPGGDAAKAAAQTQANAAAADAAKAAPAADARVFSAVLAAQVDANAKVIDAAPEQRPLSGIAGPGAAQAADKSAPAQAAQGPRAPRVPLQQQVMEQVSVQIDKAVKDGADSVRIQLRPHDLGKIEVRLEMHDGRVTATVTADKPETLALLQRDSKGLEKALEDAGLKPEANSTSFNLRGGEHQNNADRGNNNQRAGRNHGGGPGFADGDNPAASAEAPPPRRANGRSGVDISV